MTVKRPIDGTAFIPESALRYAEVSGKQHKLLCEIQEKLLPRIRVLVEAAYVVPLTDAERIAEHRRILAEMNLGFSAGLERAEEDFRRHKEAVMADGQKLENVMDLGDEEINLIAMRHGLDKMPDNDDSDEAVLAEIKMIDEEFLDETSQFIAEIIFDGILMVACYAFGKYGAQTMEPEEFVKRVSARWRGRLHGYINPTDFGKLRKALLNLLPELLKNSYMAISDADPDNLEWLEFFYSECQNKIVIRKVSPETVKTWVNY